MSPPSTSSTLITFAVDLRIQYNNYSIDITLLLMKLNPAMGNTGAQILKGWDFDGMRNMEI